MTDHLVVRLQRVLRPVQGTEGGPFVYKSPSDRLQYGRNLTLPETVNYLVVGLQCFLRLVQPIEGEPFVHESGRNRLLEGWRVTLPETTGHLVASLQYVVQPVQRAEGSPSVHEGGRNRLLEGRDFALPETTDHLVASLQCFLRPIQRAEGGPFVHKSLGDPPQNGGNLTLSEATDYLLIGRHRVCPTVPNIQSVLEEVPRRPLSRFALSRFHPIVIRLNANRSGSCHIRWRGVPAGNHYETGRHHRQQLVAVLGQARQLHQRRKCDPM